MDLRNAKIEVATLLSKTLVGTIKVMIELSSYANPHLYEMTSRMSKYGKEILGIINYDRNYLWVIDLAINLSQIGCLSLNSLILNKRYSNIILKVEDQEKYNDHPRKGGDLIAKIPRLDKVAEIVRNQFTHPNDIRKGTSEIVEVGIGVLNLLITYEDLLLKGYSKVGALNYLTISPPGYPKPFIDAFSKIINEEIHSVLDNISVDKAKKGMVLAEDIISKDGDVLIIKSTILTDTLINMLNFLNRNGELDKISVLKRE